MRQNNINPKQAPRQSPIKAVFLRNEYNTVVAELPAIKESPLAVIEKIHAYTPFTPVIRSSGANTQMSLEHFLNNHPEARSVKPILHEFCEDI